MPGISAKIGPLIDRAVKYPPDGSDAVQIAKGWSLPRSAEFARGLDNVVASLKQLHVAARQSEPQITKFIVTDGTTGKVLVALGEYEVPGGTGKTSGGYFSEFYAGDPFGGSGRSDPAEAIFRVTRDGAVQVGQNGWVDVLDPYAASAAWIGTQFDTITVTGAANNGSGLIRLTVSEDVLITGDESVRVLNVGGVPNATGVFTVTRISATQIDLQDSVFVGTYTSGGTVDRLLHITGAANNGSGLIRLTRAAHGYESGDTVNVQSVGGVPNATGQWVIDVISSSTFDLLGSTWGGAYTTGGTVLRYFAGMLAQTFAIGESFPNYKLRAFADGSLKIRDATIDLSSPDGRILIDPSVPVINFYDAADTLTMEVGRFGPATSDIGINIEFGTSTVVIGKIGAGALEVGMTIDNSGVVTTIQDGILVETVDNRTLLDGTFISAQAQADDSSFTILSGGPGAFVSLQVEAVDSVGEVRLHYGAELGFILYSAGLIPVMTIDPDGNIETDAAIQGDSIIADTTLDADTVNAISGFLANGTPGIDLTASFGMSLSLSSFTDAVRGTPGAGQSNFTAVSTVTLNTTSRTFTKGILTA
jgi:hypothetical protein